MPAVVFLSGSNKDDEHIDTIREGFYEGIRRNGITGWVVYRHVLSAHKKTRELLDQIEEYNAQKQVIFVTCAGLSNALSGVVACNTHHPVIACPPYKSIEDYMVDIHSTLRMPSDTPVLTVISPQNCAQTIIRLIEMILAK